MCVCVHVRMLYIHTHIYKKYVSFTKHLFRLSLHKTISVSEPLYSVYLVLLVEIAPGAEQDAGDSSVAIAGGSVHRGVSVLKQREFHNCELLKYTVYFVLPVKGNTQQDKCLGESSCSI